MAEVTSEGMRFVDNYRGSTLVRARWAEPPGGELYQEFGCQTPRLGEIQAVTQFSKAKVEKLYVRKVNVHIRIMYRRLGEIFSDFQKSPWKKWRFRLQRPFAPYHTIFERLTDFSTTILCQLFRFVQSFHTSMMRSWDFRRMWSEDVGSRADHSWNEELANKSHSQLEVSEWSLLGGPGGEGTEGVSVVSCQLLASRRWGV